ncbi:thiolase [Variovorax paradoxus]|uniref:acetyl-CoA acetyltransferase n=1 Tax=Comamonadaceae TaxID=80864 RepID=UPI00056F601D|nr:acetyl-CoA acetyltransferase [Xenophilus azovorans]KPU99602.1 thiolase [Variovorax paradoxus]VTY39524.1 3-ketoacyl-CoA thiolase [Xylophilus ampelinus]KPV00394.1 thiolase [Variovorax paradoxus]KPV07757.1 thiolase [Variovorax paradoxus]KPV15367.1 thiolase [Variovorax paradoxus]
MSGSSLRGSAAIVGAALAGLGEAPGSSSEDIAIEASVRALAEAGLTTRHVDAVFGSLPGNANPLSALLIAEMLGIQPKFTDNNRTGGSTFLSYTLMAAMALKEGLCETALIFYGSNQRTASGKLVSSVKPFAYEAPYAPIFPATSYALAASRHMHAYGTTREQLAAVAVAARAWANLNPQAFMRGPLSVADVLASRMVSSPLTVRDCCLVTDGGAAIVMTRADRARHLPKKPVYLLGAAAATTHMNIVAMADLTRTAAVDSGQRAMAMAGVAPRDIDVVELYDAFTINTILFLEDLGFCAKGEGGAFVASGAIAPGGALPVNTNGGGLSCVHPGMYGMFTLVEAVQQLRGEAGERQVAGAELALCHGNGGVLSSQITNVLGTEATL